VVPGPDPRVLPTTLRLKGIFPNPFNPSTVVEFDLPRSGLVNLDIFNLQGRLIEPVSREWLAAGSHRLELNGANLPSGIYLVRVSSGFLSVTTKAVLLK
jgi:hypothetical protein